MCSCQTDLVTPRDRKAEDQRPSLFGGAGQRHISFLGVMNVAALDPKQLRVCGFESSDSQTIFQIRRTGRYKLASWEPHARGRQERDHAMPVGIPNRDDGIDQRGALSFPSAQEAPASAPVRTSQTPSPDGIGSTTQAKFAPAGLVQSRRRQPQGPLRLTAESQNHRRRDQVSEGSL